MRSLASLAIVLGAEAVDFCCYWPVAKDLSGCDTCATRAYDTDGRADCESDPENTWCPSSPPTSTPSPTPSPGPGMNRRQSCYVTSYGFNDNDPPSAEIAYPGSGPGRHSVATEGKGKHSDPISFASDKDEIPIGSLIYVPHLRKYFIMEDYCASCVQEWEASGKWHVDLWMGPSAGSQEWSQLGPCEDYVTRQADIILEPTSDWPVDDTPLFDGTSCTAVLHDASSVSI